MIRLSAAPLHDWQRHHATAHRIAYDLRGDRYMLRHRTRLLVTMVMPMYQVGRATAMKAIALARASA